MVTSNVYTGPVPTVIGEASIVASLVMGQLPWKKACSVATTGNVAIATGLEAGDTIDGQTLVEGWRVLVWLNTDASENGIYVVPASGAATRAVDFDSDSEIRGSLVTVIAGTLYGGRMFRNTNTAAITVDTDDITFELWPSVTAAAESSMVPYSLVDGETFTVPVRKQALFTETIDVAAGASLVVDGHLLEVA